MIGDISAKDSSLGEEFHSLHLVGSEQLQVHMDCMNALGQIVKIEDVDDMGGLVSQLVLRDGINLSMMCVCSDSVGRISGCLCMESRMLVGARNRL